MVDCNVIGSNPDVIEIMSKWDISMLEKMNEKTLFKSHFPSN
jgi:hypothetical protein